MRAWQAGIVMVAAAGNTGPDPMSIGIPGNVPYIITVGAMTDNYTPTNPADDRLASFSATGPTVEGFVKPECSPPAGTFWDSCRPPARSPYSILPSKAAPTTSPCRARRKRGRV